MIDLQEHNFLASSTGDSVSVEMISTNMEGNLPQTVKNHVLVMPLKAVVEHGETVSTQLVPKVCSQSKTKRSYKLPLLLGVVGVVPSQLTNENITVRHMEPEPQSGVSSDFRLC